MKPIPREIKNGYPQTGTGIRQGERLERQRLKWMLDFTATARCLRAIKARLAAR